MPIRKDGNGRRLKMASGCLVYSCPFGGYWDSDDVDHADVGGSVAVAFSTRNIFNFRSEAVRYTRATNAAGTTWTRASCIVRGELVGLGVMGSGSASYPGHPYIIFWTPYNRQALNNPADRGLYITVAKTADGLAGWTAPHFITNLDQGGVVEPNGTIVVDDKYPAVHAPNAQTGGFWRAGDTDGGGTWTKTLTGLESVTGSAGGAAITLIAGWPAIAIDDPGNAFNSRVWYVRALDALGATWGNVSTYQITHAEGAEFSNDVRMCDHNGVPAIVSLHNLSLFARSAVCFCTVAADAAATSWGANYEITPAGQSGGRPHNIGSDGTALRVLHHYNGNLYTRDSLDSGVTFGGNTNVHSGINESNIKQKKNAIFIGSNFHSSWEDKDVFKPAFPPTDRIINIGTWINTP